MVSEAGATVSLFQQKGFVSLHSINIIPLFHTQYSRFKKCFSESQEQPGAVREGVWVAAGEGSSMQRIWEIFEAV